jgi:hypothetical protein
MRSRRVQFVVPIRGANMQAPAPAIARAGAVAATKQSTV